MRGIIKIASKARRYMAGLFYCDYVKIRVSNFDSWENNNGKKDGRV